MDRKKQTCLTFMQNVVFCVLAHIVEVNLCIWWQLLNGILKHVRLCNIMGHHGYVTTAQLACVRCYYSDQWMIISLKLFDIQGKLCILVAVRCKLSMYMVIINVEACIFFV